MGRFLITQSTLKLPYRLAGTSFTSLSLTITADPNSFSPPRPDFQESFFPLLQHFLAATDIAAVLSFLSFSRKRKRSHFQGLDDSDNDNDSGPKLGRLGSVVYRNPESFKQFFRMKTSTFEWLCGLLEPLLDCRDPVDSALNLPTETRLGIGLFRLATGADYAEIAGRFGVPEADSKLCVKQLCRVLCTNYRFCGIISCTRFNFQSVHGDSIPDTIAQQESIAAQFVVDSSSRILSIVAGFRGTKSNEHILKSSTLYKDIEKGKIVNSQCLIYVNDVAIPQYILGKGEYPLLSWLLVPFVDPEPGSVEENFNNAHRLMSVSSSKAIASLKNWGVLKKAIKTEYKAAVACVGACSILHNMLIMREDYSAFCGELDDRVCDDKRIASSEGNLTEGMAHLIRNALAARARN